MPNITVRSYSGIYQQQKYGDCSSFWSNVKENDMDGKKQQTSDVLS
jgi:hypothetical protein